MGCVGGVALAPECLRRASSGKCTLECTVECTLKCTLRGMKYEG